MKYAAPIIPPIVATIALKTHHGSDLAVRTAFAPLFDRIEPILKFRGQVAGAPHDFPHEAGLQRAERGIDHEPDDGADDAGVQTDLCTLAHRQRPWLVLSLHVGGQNAAADDPQAAAVAELHDRQRRQHPDEETAEQERHLQLRALSRSTRGRGA